MECFILEFKCTDGNLIDSEHETGSENDEFNFD